MKSWDTNFLVRHLAEDDKRQLGIVRKELEQAARRAEPVWISNVVLVETAWVLRGYGLTKKEVLDVLDVLQKDGRFQFEAGSNAAKAIRRARSKGDLPEHLSALSAKVAGAVKTQTFDQAVRLFSEFEVFS